MPWVPRGTCIAEIVAVVRVHIWGPWSGAGNKATAAEKSPLLPHPAPLPLPACGPVWGQKHTSDHRDASADPSGRQNRVCQQNGRPLYLNVTARAGLEPVCSYIRNTTAIDFVDRLKCRGMCAKLVERLTEAVLQINPT